MSYNDSYDEPRRSNRRAPREPAGPAKIQGSTAAAILVFVAIVGFGLGAILANVGGGDDPATEIDPNDAATNNGTDTGDPAEQPDDSQTEDTSDDGNGDEEVVGGEGIALTSPQNGGEVPAGESGTIDVQATLDSGQGGVALRVERSLNSGQTWEAFCDACTGEASGSGTYSTNFWTGQTGENQFRVVGPDGLASNPITVTVVDSGEDSG